ncbi:sigma-70 family RNA polymerase sigma factor [Alphaproteobacteria bacterium KMM 3653]|uniref:Sigma-70 family RNA polymerase sigma factor n=2 Tax=Harenicola maris TaxID=2841044 RepID=A0AAP2G4D1_9RHOB|nr:sigma-70 family RNA polymerase sigma factor [Harenicola maris]
MIARTALGDRAAFSALYDRTAAKLFSVSMRVLGETAAAEDALQDTFEKIWRQSGRFRAGKYSPMSWLITVARNTAIDRLRQRKGQAAPMEEADWVADPGPGPEEAAIARSEAGRVGACMGELKPEHRQAIQSAYLDGLSYAEISQRQDIPLNTIRTWLRRSLQTLKDCLSR